MSGHASRVKRDIERWLETGLVDAATAGALTRDIEKNAVSRFNLGYVLGMMAGALFAAALLLIVAANWEAIPRLARVGTLFAIIAGGYVGGAHLARSGRTGFAEALWLVAATAFGATIALIGQMYHLTGDEKQAVLVWCLGTTFAAAALRSGALTVGAVLLAGAWMLMHALAHWTFRGLPMAYLPLAASLYALSFWTRSSTSRHLLTLSLPVFGLLHYARSEVVLGAPIIMVVAGSALFAVGQWLPEIARRYIGLGTGWAFHALILFLTGIGIAQWTFIDEPEFLFVSIVGFAGIVSALLLAGRDNGWLRWLAYLAFVFQLGFIYVVMLGTMLGTAGFFIVGGLVLSGLAWLIARIEGRLSPPTATGEIKA